MNAVKRLGLAGMLGVSIASSGCAPILGYAIGQKTGSDAQGNLATGVLNELLNASPRRPNEPGIPDSINTMGIRNGWLRIKNVRAQHSVMIDNVRGIMFYTDFQTSLPANTSLQETVYVYDSRGNFLKQFEGSSFTLGHNGEEIWTDHGIFVPYINFRANESGPTDLQYKVSFVNKDERETIQESRPVSFWISSNDTPLRPE